MTCPLPAPVPPQPGTAGVQASPATAAAVVGSRCS